MKLAYKYILVIKYILVLETIYNSIRFYNEKWIIKVSLLKYKIMKNISIGDRKFSYRLINTREHNCSILDYLLSDSVKYCERKLKRNY